MRPVARVGHQLCAALALGGNSRYAFAHTAAEYRITRNGVLSVKLDTEVGNSVQYLPRFGVACVMPEETEKLDFFAYGPEGSYNDFLMHAYRAHFRSTVSDQIEHFVYPQENCSHYGVKWFELTTLGGHGLRFETVSPDASFSASHYSTSQLWQAKHDYELVPDERTFVCFDYKMSGLGSGSCGPLTRDVFRLSEKKFVFEFTVKAIMR